MKKEFARFMLAHLGDVLKRLRPCCTDPWTLAQAEDAIDYVHGDEFLDHCKTMGIDAGKLRKVVMQTARDAGMAV